MKRYTFDLTQLTHEHGTRLIPHVKRQLSELELTFFVDNELLFWRQHFDDAVMNGAGFATYKNGHKKGGTLRFKAGHVRIPAYDVLPVYLAEDHKEGYNPRQLVQIPSFVVCQAQHLSQEELDMDGFRDHAQMLEDMKAYYPAIAPDSMVSFYRFGEGLLWPTTGQIKSYFHTHPPQK